jgi:hypothetical protein
MNMFEIGKDIWEIILLSLDVKDWYSLRRTCKFFFIALKKINLECDMCGEKEMTTFSLCKYCGGVYCNSCNTPTGSNKLQCSHCKISIHCLECSYKCMLFENTWCGECDIEVGKSESPECSTCGDLLCTCEDYILDKNSFGFCSVCAKTEFECCICNKTVGVLDFNWESESCYDCYNNQGKKRPIIKKSKQPIKRAKVL